MLKKRMQKLLSHWRSGAVILIALAALALGYDYIIGTAFFEYLDTIDPANHRH